MTKKTTKTAFGRYIVTLPMSCITAQREPAAATKSMACYKRIASSIEHIGLIEPLVVFEQTDGSFLLVDGNTRFSILKSKGVTEVACIVAKDDEAYTYNRRVSHVPPISQHFMLLRVLDNGVSEDRVAAALNVDISQLVRDARSVRDEEVAAIFADPFLAEIAALLQHLEPMHRTLFQGAVRDAAMGRRRTA